MGGGVCIFPPSSRVSQFNVPVAVTHDRGDGGVGTPRCGGSPFFLPSKESPRLSLLDGASRGESHNTATNGEEGGGTGHGGDKKKKEEEGGGFGDMAEKCKMLPSPSSFLSLFVQGCCDPWRRGRGEKTMREGGSLAVVMQVFTVRVTFLLLLLPPPLGSSLAYYKTHGRTYGGMRKRKGRELPPLSPCCSPPFYFLCDPSPSSSSLPNRLEVSLTGRKREKGGGIANTASPSKKVNLKYGIFPQKSLLFCHFFANKKLKFSASLLVIK